MTVVQRRSKPLTDVRRRLMSAQTLDEKLAFAIVEAACRHYPGMGAIEEGVGAIVPRSAAGADAA